MFLVGSLFVVIAGILISTLHFSVFYYSHDTPKWFVFDVLVTLYVAYSLKSKKQIQYTYVGGLVLLLVYWMAISLWWAPHKVAGLEFIIRFCNAILFGYCLVQNYSREKLTGLFLNTVFWSAFVFSLVFLVERYVFQQDFNAGTFSPVGFINNTSAVFNIWVPGLVLYCIRQRKNTTFLFLGITTLLVIVSTLMQAGTRGAILGLSISEIIIFLMVLRKNARQAVAFLTITMLLLAGIGIYNVFDSLQNGRLDERLTLMKNSIGGSAERRLLMYGNTWNMAQDNPFGVGVNNFEYVHPKYGQPGTANASPFINEHQILRTPHNIILKVFSELGYIGGSMFTLLLLYCFRIAIVNAWRGDYIDKWLFVGVSATLFHTMASAVLLIPTSLFFFAFLIATIINRRQPQVILKAQWSFRLPVVLKGMYATIPVFALVTFTSEYYAFQGRVNFDGQQLEKAVLFNPQNDRALLDLSQYRLMRNRDVAGSLEALDRFLALYPYHIAALQMKAERHYQLNDLVNAQNTLEKLLEFYPSYEKAQRLKQIVDIKIRRINRTN